MKTLVVGDLPRRLGVTEPVDQQEATEPSAPVWETSLGTGLLEC